jgi:hypothetical protein
MWMGERGNWFRLEGGEEKNGREGKEGVERGRGRIIGSRRVGKTIVSRFSNAGSS